MLQLQSWLRDQKLIFRDSSRVPWWNKTIGYNPLNGLLHGLHGALDDDIIYDDEEEV